MKKIYFTFLAVLLLAMPAGATGKIYAVIMGNTLDPKIGCKVDLDRFENELMTLACNLDLDRVPTIRFDGNNCDRPHLEQGLNQLRSCTRDDIVFFYYTGHGGRAKNDKTQWPQLCLKYNEDRFYVPAHEIISKVSALPAHLKFVITDCCNKISPGMTPKFWMNARGASDVSEVNYENLAKLFIRQNGLIIATGCQVDEYSWGDANQGGVFSNSFWEALDEASTGEIQPTWDAVFKRVVNITRTNTKNDQTPLYQLPTEAPTSGTITQPTTPVQPVAIGNSTVNSNMLASISQLLNRNVEIANRLRMIDGIVGNYFSGPSAGIQTIGRDMKTIVDTEDVKTFLRRITFDKKIRQINVVECRDSYGKCTYLKVHEVRDELQR